MTNMHHYHPSRKNSLIMFGSSSVVQPFVVVLLLLLPVIVEPKKVSSIRSSSRSNYYYDDDHHQQDQHSTFLRSSTTGQQKQQDDINQRRRRELVASTSSKDEYNYFTTTIDTAAKIFIDLVLKRNLNITGYSNVGYGNGPSTTPSSYYDGPLIQMEGVASVRDQDITGNTNSDDSNNDSYGTNNQEDTIEEGDSIVSDGTYVYAAYGKYFVVWDATDGTILATVQIPLSSADDDPSSSSSSSQDRLFLPPGYWHPPEPSIQSLVVHDGRLLVIVSGSNVPPILFDKTSSSSSNSQSAPEKHIVLDYMATQIRIYDTAVLVSSTSSTTDMEEAALIGSVNINGNYNSVRVVKKNGVAHVVTMSSIDTNTNLVQPFEKWNYPATISDDDYTTMVSNLQQQQIDIFCETLLNDLQGNLNSNSTTIKKIPPIGRIDLWNETIQDPYQQILLQNSVFNSLSLIYSFNLTATTAEEIIEQGSVPSSIAFVPAYWSQVYSSNDILLIASNVYYYSDITGISTDTVALTAFQILDDDDDSTKTIPLAIATVEGSLLNSYSLDIYNHTVRIATTEQLVVPTYAPSSSPIVSATSDSPTNSDNIIVTAASGDLTTTTDDNFNIIGTDSSTANYIIVLELPDYTKKTKNNNSSSTVVEMSIMKELGRVQLGEPNEVFTAVRFLDAPNANIAYAVTYEQKDPFYVVDLQDSSNPKAIAAINVSGFSNYLHPINPPNNTLIIAVGEDTDTDGNILGVQFTLFDVTDPTNPTAKHRYNIEKDNNTYSYTESSWDYKSIRYYDGHLYIPVDTYSYDPSSGNTNTDQTFHGFMIFEVNEDNGFKEVKNCRIGTTDDTMTVSHPDPIWTVVDLNATTLPPTREKICHYCGGYLPRRSFVFNNTNIVTVDGGSTYSQTNLNTCQQNWNQTISIIDPTSTCCNF